MARTFVGFQFGATSAYSPTSEYVVFGKAPAVGRLTKYEVVTSPATSMPIDLRFAYSIVSDSSRFNYIAKLTTTTTALLTISSGFTGTMEQRGHTFQFLAKQSGTSTDFNGTIKIHWLSLT